ncbi:MAG: hypothetical protein AAF226_16230 [Verrucomicrobiota bacterium]
MADLSHDDIAYAMETTKVIREPDRRIDTFGTTNFEFVMVSELMDSVNQVRVREGRVEAARPTIIRPEGYDDLNFEGFGEHAEAFADWFKEVGGNLAFFKYGFTFAQRDLTEHVAHEPIESVVKRVEEDIESANNPSKALIVGIDDTWEISLMKFTFEMIEKSLEINVFDFKRRGLL